MDTNKPMRLVGGVVLAVALLAGCDQDERPLNYQKGTYLGKQDQPVSERTLQALRARAAYQGGGTSIAGGGREAEALADRVYVRPPEQLEDRARKQAGTE